MNRKKLFIVTGILAFFFMTIVIVIVFFGFQTTSVQNQEEPPAQEEYDYGYLLDDENNPDTQQSGDQEQENEEVPDQPKPSLRKLSSSSTVGAWIHNGQPYYITRAGVIRTLDTESTAPTTVNEEERTGIHNVISSPNGSRVIVFRQVRGRTTTDIFNVESASWSPLSATVSTADFITDSILVWGRALFDGLTALETKNIETGEVVSLEELSLQDIRVDGLESGNIALFTPPSFYDSASSYLYNSETDIVSVIALEKRGLSLLWSPEGDRALAFWTEGSSKNRSALIDVEGNIITTLQAALLPQKCTFANNTLLVCAVPVSQDFSNMSIMPDSYLQHKVQTVDMVIALNTETGRTSTLYTGGEDIDIYKPVMNAGVLYFINRYDDRLYSLTFPQNKEGGS